MTKASEIADLEVALARVQAEIDETHRPDDLKPTKLQMRLYSERLDALTATRREIKASIVALRDAPAERVFPLDIENAAACEAFAIMRQRQLDGLLSSLGHSARSA